MNLEPMRLSTKTLILFFLLLRSAEVSAQCGPCQYEAQLITNGDFSQGNSGFMTDYDLGFGFCALCPESTYGVGFNAFFFHTDFVGTDHTNPPLENFMIVNGSTIAGTEVWCQLVNLQPSTSYTFSYWMQDVADNPNLHPLAQLVVMIDGVQLGSMMEAEGGWQEWTATWNSGMESQVEICIINNQNQGGGNDFGLDDISMTACQAYQIANTAYAGEDQTICSEEQIQLGEPSVTNFSYSWDNAMGLSSTSSSNPTIAIANNTGTPITQQYILTTDSAGVGCVMQDTVLITILPVPVFWLGNDVVICEGETTTLDAGPGWDNVMWSTGENAQTIETGIENTYTATVEFNGCNTSDNVIVEVIEMPEIDLGPNQLICEDDEAILASPVVAEWSTGESAMFITVNTTGSYWGTYEEQGCLVSDTVFVEVYTYPVVTLEEEAFFCEGESVTLNAGMTVYWSTNVDAQSIEVNEQGNYTWLAANGPCGLSGNVYVYEIPLPVADLGGDFYGCDDDVAELNADEEINFYNNYFWSTTDTVPAIDVNQSGIYWVIESNDCGLASDTIEVFFEPCGYGLFIPNACTANGDGKNDGWFVEGYNIKQVKIHVYNRLGNLIHYSEALGEEWLPGIFLPGDDAYNYLINAVSIYGDEFERRGHIYLLR